MYIVTGGAGFIGSAMVWALNNRNIQDIIVVDELGEQSKWHNLSNLHIQNVIHPDEAHDWTWKNKHILKGIIHMGACSTTTEEDADFLMKNNVHVSMDYFELCTTMRIPFIYASSAATYGAIEEGFSDIHSRIPSLRPINKYGFSKHLFDKWALNQTCQPPTWAGLKFFNVYGPNEYHKGSQASVALHAYPQVTEKGQVNLFKSYRPEYEHGDQQRDFVYIKDVIKVIEHFLFNTDSSHNGIYNVGTGEPRSFKDLIEACFAALNLESKINFIEMPEALKNQYQYYTKADLTKLREIGGYKEKFTSLEEGVRDYYTNYLAPGNKHL